MISSTRLRNSGRNVRFSSAQESFETQYMAEFNPEFDWSSFPYTVEEEKKDSE